MGMTGRFEADFQPFFDACQKAEVSLRPIEAGASKVGASLNRMTDSFSGRKIIQEATLMAEVFQRAGGASAFTEKELKRMGATGAEAVAKLRAMGQEIPPKLQAIADAASHATGGWDSFGKSVLASAAGFVSAQALIGAVKGAVSALVDEIGKLTLGGAAVADVSESFDRLTVRAGLLGSQLLGTLKAGVHGTVSDLELMKIANQDLAAGFTLTSDKAAILTQGAFALAQATGGDVKTALEAMNDALLTGRTRAVEMLTGKIDLEKAEDRYAASLGRAGAKLSDAGQLEAKRVAILDAVTAATDRLGVQTDGLDEIVAQAQTSWANFENELGKTINQSPVLTTAILGIGQAVRDTFGGTQQALVAALARQFDQALISIVGLAKTGVEAGGFLVKEWYAAQKVFGNIAQIVDGVRLSLLYAQQAAASGILPGTTDIQKWKALDTQIGNLLVTMHSRGQAMQEETRHQEAVDASVAKLNKSLAVLQGRMVDAADGHKDVSKAADGVTSSTQRMVPAGDAAAGMFKVTGDAAKLAAKQLKEFNEQLNSASAMERAGLGSGGLAPSILSGGTAALDIKPPLSTGHDPEWANWMGAKITANIPIAVQQAGPAIEASGSTLGKRFADGMGLAIQFIPGMERVADSFYDARRGADSFKAGIDAMKMGEITTGLFSIAGGAMQIAQGFMQATESAGKAKGALSGAAYGAQAGSAFGPWGTAVGAGIGAIAGAIRGGKSPAEEGRELAASFRAEMEKGLTLQQKLEAGNERWKASVIALRDAFIKFGHTEQEALALSQKLWEAEKQGPEAVIKVLEEISRVLVGDFLPDSERATALAALGFKGLIDYLDELRAKAGDPLELKVTATADKDAQSVLKLLGISWVGAGGGSGGGGGSGNGSPGVPGSSGTSIGQFLLANGARDLGRYAESQTNLNEFGDNITDPDLLRSMRNKFDNEAKNYALDNAAELERLKREHEEGLPRYATGTRGKFLNFGSGTKAILDGKERVMTEAEGKAEASGWGDGVDRLEGRLASIERMLERMPIMLRDASMTRVSVR